MSDDRRKGTQDNFAFGFMVGSALTAFVCGLAVNWFMSPPWVCPNPNVTSDTTQVEYIVAPFTGSHDTTRIDP